MASFLTILAGSAVEVAVKVALAPLMMMVVAHPLLGSKAVCIVEEKMEVSNVMWEQKCVGDYCRMQSR